MLTSCTYCSTVFEVDDKIFGQETKCENCQKIFRAMMYIGSSTENKQPERKEKSQKKVSNDDSVIICTSCKKEIPSSSKFCSECGNSIQRLEKESAVKQDVDIPIQGITIEFAESTAASFDSALKQAKSAFTFQECKRGKKQWYYATWSKEQIFEVIKLTKELKGLRNRKVYIDGKEHSWNDVFYFVYCMESRQQAYRPDEYCFGIDDGRLNIWGCKNANMEWTNWAKWFSFGSFKNKEKFVFDKKRMRHDLENNLYKIRFCPFFSPQLVETVFSLLPNEATVSDKGYWEYKRCYDEVPGAIKVKRVTDNGGFRYTDEFFSDGVSPKGIDEAVTILHNAFKTLGRKQLIFKK